ncbi:hypothetical protein GOB94_03065 [Granulicella sp. 5B5]|uniref:hypothetical protein n=1 Tax=Granulicella sp. 5B5 TaxID=1617967 RepID=UPI0015F4F450|nr:hypothetical protein [Granulicella sp. 5B5]QMV17791.1 hypothetical protein GOB94_03065 [Granulicella sp. 5B5]
MKIRSLFGYTVASLALLLTLGAAKPAKAQFSINIGVPPSCAYGYYDYAPYSCAPVGFYGPGYFYNGIFLGVGPWYRWGYSHGWGGHRFSGGGGGRYRGNGGYRGGGVRGGGYRGGGYHGGGAHGAIAHGGGGHAGGGGGHAGGGGAHGGGGHGGGGHH